LHFCSDCFNGHLLHVYYIHISHQKVKIPHLGRAKSLDNAWKEEELRFAETAGVLGNLRLVARLLVIRL